MHLGNPEGHVKHGSSPVVMPWIHDGQYSKLLPFLVPDVHVQLTRIALLKVESVWHSTLLHLFPEQRAKPESKSFFLQEGLVQISNSAPVKNAFRILKEKATLTHSLRLASLAATVRTCGGKFDKVLEAIDKMIKTLKEEGEEDVKKRDQCKEQYQKINSTVSDLQWKVEVNDAKIAKLEKKIEKSKAEKEQTIKDIEQVQKDLKEMKDNRENENQAFLEAKKADEDAIKLIKEAKDVLAEFYSKNKMKISFAQGGKPEFEEDPDKAPEFKLTEKGKRKGQAKGILGLMDLIMGDLKDDIAADIKAEEKAQKSYEKAKTAAEKLEKELETKKTNLEEAISQRNEEKTDEESKKKKNEADLDDENKFKAEIKPDCDWILQNFEKRRKARTAEMDGLIGAKDFLSGAQESSASLLQQEPRFDDEAFSHIGFSHISGDRFLGRD